MKYPRLFVIEILKPGKISSIIISPNPDDTMSNNTNSQRSNERNYH